MAADEFIRCPYCAEEIRVEAIKCRYCGEFLVDEDDEDDQDVAGPVWEYGWLGWKCIEHDKVVCIPCRDVATPPLRVGGFKRGAMFPSASGEVFTGSSARDVGPYEGKRRHRRKLTEVGTSSENGERACPRCGSTNFTAKRSAKGKMLAGVLAPKTRVKCVACGLMFLRG